MLLFKSTEHVQTLGNMQKQKMHQWSVKMYIKTIKKFNMAQNVAITQCTNCNDLEHPEGVQGSGINPAIFIAAQIFKGTVHPKLNFCHNLLRNSSMKS